MPEYLGWSITVVEGTDGFADLTGGWVDRRASMEKFCELLREKLTDRFPGAVISVRLGEPSLRPVDVWGPPGLPGQGHAPSGWLNIDDPTEVVLREVDSIRDQLFVWGDYAVEPKL